MNKAIATIARVFWYLQKGGASITRASLSRKGLLLAFDGKTIGHLLHTFDLSGDVDRLSLLGSRFDRSLQGHEVVLRIDDPQA